jgi:hypothetical protein
MKTTDIFSRKIDYEKSEPDTCAWVKKTAERASRAMNRMQAEIRAGECVGPALGKGRSLTGGDGPAHGCV